MGSAGASESAGRSATWSHKLALLASFGVLYCLFYVYPNFYPFLTPRELPLTLVDRVTPFLPWTFLVYLSEYLLIAIAIALLKDLKVFDTFARQAFMVLFLVGSIFFVFPTIYPRPVYPAANNVAVAFAMNLVGGADAPTNCFPSLHVAITSVAVYSLRFLKPRFWFFFAIWGAAIFLSTLTTKQHYLADIAGGALVACIIISIDSWLRKRQARRSCCAVELPVYQES